MKPFPPSTSFFSGATDHYVQVPSDCRCFNPSVVEYRHRILFACRVCVKGGAIYLGTLSEDLGAVFDLIQVELPGRVEDPRLFVFKGELWISFTSLEGPGRCSLAVARLTDDLRVAEFRRIESPRRCAQEKNWQFFECQGEMMCVYSVDPHIIGCVEGTKLNLMFEHSGSMPWRYGALRGGAPPILTNDRFMHVFHSVRVVNGRNVYSGGAYTFQPEPPFEPTAICPLPIVEAGLDGKMHGPLVVYPGGVVQQDDVFVIAYGWQDAHCKLLAVPREDLLLRMMALNERNVPKVSATEETGTIILTSCSDVKEMSENHMAPNAQSKRRCLVFTVATGAQSYYEITLPRLRQLAGNMECDFASITIGPRPPSPWDTWLRFTAVTTWPTYDHYIYIDSDVVPNHLTLTRGDWEPLMGGEAVKIALDQQWGKVGGTHYVRWCKQYLRAAVPSGRPYYNCGVWSIPKAVMTCIRDALPPLNELPDEHPRDQHWLNYFLQTTDVPVEVLPRSMNWMEPDLDKVIRLAKLVHFASPSRKAVIGAFTQRLDTLAG